MPATRNTGEPFGWNRGSVRALIVVAVVFALIGLTVGVTVAILVRAEEKFLEQFALLIAAAFIGVVNLAAGWYFANRPPNGSA